VKLKEVTKKENNEDRNTITKAAVSKKYRIDQTSAFIMCLLLSADLSRSRWM